MLRHRRRTMPQLPMRLIYSVRHADDVIYADELDADALVTFTRDAPEGWKGHVGHIDAALIDQASSSFVPGTAFVCGSNGFVEAASDLLLGAGFMAERDPYRALRADRCSDWRMTDTREILDASPAPVALGLSEVAAAIDACLNCGQTCTTCADADLVEDDVDEMRTCIALCLNCASVCEVTAQVLSRPARLDPTVALHLLQACVRTCTASAEECARHAAHHRHCAICEKACRTCLEACTDLLAAAAFTDAEKPDSA